jgi:2-C-methyl-D-erythritol 4-phosphate cytidylyltransferase
VTVWTIVVAAGSGSRFGDATPPKQYASLGTRRVLDWALLAARDAGDGVVLVVGAGRTDDPEPGADVVVAGGVTRSDSVRRGLVAVPVDADVIVVHDAARPLASSSLFTTVIEAVRDGADGAVPGIPMVDTIKRASGDRVMETIDRTDLVAVQTPQAFRAETLRRAHADPSDATDDAALVEAIGGTVVVVPGEMTNLKITTPDDLAVARLHAG